MLPWSYDFLPVNNGWSPCYVATETRIKDQLEKI